MIGIHEMFAALDGRDRMWEQLEIWAAFARARKRERTKAWKLGPGRRRTEAYQAAYRARPENRRKAVDRTRAWRHKNRDKARELARRMHQRWKERNPEKYREKRRRAKALYKQRHPEKVRERNRRNQAARRARLKAQATRNR